MVMKGVMADSVSFFSGNTNQNMVKPAMSDNKFEKVMDQNLSTSKQNNAGKETTKKSEMTNGTQTTEDATKTDVTGNDKIKSTKKAQETKNVDATDEALTGTEQTEQSTDIVQLMEQILSTLGTQISDAVKKVLNISEEELTNVMEQLGMQMTDLLQPTNLQQLILAVNGNEDVTALLTNEVMATEYSQLSDELKSMDLNSDLTSDLCNEFGITKEEFKTMLDNLPNTMAATKKIAMETEEPATLDMQHQADAPKEPVVEITVETQTNNPNQTMKQSNSELQSDNKDQPKEGGTTSKTIVDNLVQNFAGVTVQNTEEISGQTDKITQMREIVTQVVDKIKILIQPEASSMEIQLNPENLGKVNLSVVAKNGQLTASFVTENQLAKEALENQLYILKENLNNQGIKVDAIEVTVSNFSFQQSNQTDSGSKQQKGNTKRQINLEGFNYTEDSITEEELLAARVLAQNGGSVDYTA